LGFVILLLAFFVAFFFFKNVGPDTTVLIVEIDAREEFLVGVIFKLVPFIFPTKFPYLGRIRQVKELYLILFSINPHSQARLWS
jgi:hypothetical protein